MIRALILAALLPLSGCASLWYAGESDYSLWLPSGVVVMIHSGKQEQAVNASFKSTPGGYEIDLQETGVQAFQGQQIAASAAAVAASDATAAAVQALKSIK